MTYNSKQQINRNPLDQALEARTTLSGLIFAAMAMPEIPKVIEKTLPLTILGGFLGAGKTTMLNHLLQNPGGRKITVLVNDFGKINIDSAMIESQTDNMINLSNGCACCAVSSDLTKSLIEITEREEQPDAIILECSGVAEPGSIAQIILSNKSIRLDGIISLVDAETLFDRIEDQTSNALFIDQLESADIISIGKLDLLSDEEREKVIVFMNDNFPNKSIIETYNGEVATDVILGVSADHKEDESKKVKHSQPFESISFSFDQPFNEEKFNKVISNLPDQIIRAKGVLQLDNNLDKKMIYQRVSKRWTLKADENWENDKPLSELVFIANKGTINKDLLEKNLTEALLD